MEKHLGKNVTDWYASRWALSYMLYDAWLDKKKSALYFFHFLIYFIIYSIKGSEMKS